MKCEDVQFSLWSGAKSADIEAHLQTCAACKQESDAMHHVMERLGELDVPTPSRSLKPTQAVIRQAVAKNKRMRWMKSTTVAASITVLLGAGAALGWNHLGTSDSAGKTADNGQQQATTGPDKTTQPPSTPVADQNTALVTVDSKATHQDDANMIKNYLTSQVKPSEIKHITILDFVPDAEGQKEVITGTVTMNVDLQSGATVNGFKQGTQKGAVKIALHSGDYYVDFFEQLRRPAASPDEVVKSFTSAAKSRDGMGVFGLYSAEQRDAKREEFAANHWSYGMSSPWIESFEMVDTRQENGNTVVDAKLNLATSTGPAGSQMAHFTLQQVQNKDWYIQDLQIDAMAGAFPTQMLDLGNGNKLGAPDMQVDYNGAKLSLSTVSVQSDGMEMMHAVGNHAGVMKQEDVTTPIGKAIYAVVDRDNGTAASGAVGTHKEYWLTVLRDNPDQKDSKIALSIILQGGNADEKTRKESLLKLANGWTIR